MSTKKSDYPNLGKNIRGLRRSVGETQLDLAIAIGAGGPNAISQYESGERVPERDFLLKIARHYRITENELLHGDFEHSINLTRIPVRDAAFGMAVIEKMFPLICTTEALENPKFREAYEIHLRLIEGLKRGENLDEEGFERCMLLYKEVRGKGLAEASANHLSWLMVQGFLIALLTPRLLESLEMLDGENSTTKNFLECLMPSFEEPGSESEFDTSENRQAFLEENEVDLLVDIKVLRHFEEYADLGDYYLAWRHKLGLLQNGRSPEMNNAVGDEMFSTFSLMGNKYCKIFSEVAREGE